MHPQSAKLIHLFFWRRSYTEQQILASMPTPKQLQNPRVIVFRPVSTSCLFFICIKVPSSQVLISTVHKSYHDSYAASHSTILSFKDCILPCEKLMGEPPQPKHLEKSLPVPMGMIEKTRLSVLMPALAISSTTHITVPSPPHTTTFTSRFSPFSTLLTNFDTLCTPLSLSSAENRSIRYTVMNDSLAYWKDSLRSVSVRYFLPSWPPLLELMNRKQAILRLLGYIQAI